MNLCHHHDDDNATINGVAPPYLGALTTPAYLGLDIRAPICTLSPRSWYGTTKKGKTNGGWGRLWSEALLNGFVQRSKLDLWGILERENSIPTQSIYLPIASVDVGVLPCSWEHSYQNKNITNYHHHRSLCSHRKKSLDYHHHFHNVEVKNYIPLVIIRMVIHFSLLPFPESEGAASPSILVYS